MNTTFLIGDRPVQRLGFGAMRITGTGVWGEPPDREAAKRLLCRAVELGVELIDTADAYGPDVSERLIAEALHPYPRGVVIATKGGLERGGPGSWTRNGRPAHLKAACAASLKRLRLDRIDLYQLHAVDERVPLEDSVGALADLQREGKVRHIGLSNVSVVQLAAARKIVPIVSVQNSYSLANRASDDVLAACAAAGIAFLPYFPLGAGKIGSHAALAEIARRKGATPMQVALAWLLQRAPNVLPIPGTSSVTHLEENMKAAAIALTADEVARL